MWHFLSTDCICEVCLKSFSNLQCISLYLISWVDVLAWGSCFPHFLFMSKEIIYLLLFYSVASLSPLFSRYLIPCWYFKYPLPKLLRWYPFHALWEFFLCLEFLKIWRKEINFIASALFMSIVSHLCLHILKGDGHICLYCFPVHRPLCNSEKQDGNTHSNMLSESWWAPSNLFKTLNLLT